MEKKLKKEASTMAAGNIKGFAGPFGAQKVKRSNPATLHKVLVLWMKDYPCE